VLARWASWGAIPEVFDVAESTWSRERDELRELLSGEEWQQAERTTINAHYTDPLIVRQMWAAMSRLGFREGAVLEPGCGSGTFMGMAPSGARMTGVELDTITAAVARHLYPTHRVQSESFADSRFRDGDFDGAIGNVPFGDVQLHDPIHNLGRHSLHNHFIVKALRLTRPGGVVAVLTSRYTMDAQNPAARREMAGLADLIGAVRLPNGAHRRAAGTDVVTDILLLRRRESDRPAEGDWDTVTTTPVEGRDVKIHPYFVAHPENVLGTIGVRQGAYGAETMTVSAELAGLESSLAEALVRVTDDARRRGLTSTTERPSEERAWESRTQLADPGAFEGTIQVDGAGRFRVVSDGTLAPFNVPRSAHSELVALIGLRDRATKLLTLEAATNDDTVEVDLARAELRSSYESYVRRYGPLNRYTLRPTGRTNEEGEPTYARTFPTAIRTFKADPFGPLVLALESFDETEQSATAAAILTRRVVVSRPEVRGVETPQDAVAVSLDRTGRVDLELVADLLGVPEVEARPALDGLVFADPDSGALVHAPEYLSGDVRVKLARAQAAAEKDPAFAVNVEALREVVPEPIGADEIVARMGAVWIDAETHRLFLSDLLQARDIVVENPLPGEWEVRGGRYGVRSTSEWGTDRRPAPDLAQAVMEQRTVLVYDEVDDGPGGKKRRVLNADETTAAQEKAEALQERFGEWVWEEPERAQRLVDEYNRRFNSLVLRDYSDAGDYLTLPGLAANFTPRPHQRAAVARMIAEPATGLFHEVGAGKTAVMVMGAMEMRRMGLVSKPLVVVPNHMLEQFTREWLQLYPRARILAASANELTNEKRRMFVARAAANDWDAIILTQGAFGKIPIDPETETAYIERRVADLRFAAEQAEEQNRVSVKRLQRRLLQEENKVKARLDQPRDPGVTFEATGIDYLVVDEMHMYKNLSTDSNIQDAAIQGSERSSDLHLKVEYLRSRGRDRVITGATATPIANSITEAYVMQRFLRPDLLDAAGLGSFDAWAATFGQTVTQMEMSPTGAAFRMKTRFSRFQNVPEMLRMWSVFADVKTAADLELPTPDLAMRSDGERAPQTVTVAPTPELESYVAQLAERAERIEARMVAPEDDNMLTVSTDGRKAALDVRLVDHLPSGPGKVDIAADRIVRIWQTHRDREYLDPVSGEVSPVSGGLQIVFCDLATPDAARWNAYHELRSLLADRGMPADQVRFIHEAKSDGDKARLFAAARNGHVAVLIGSTGKMGVGTNVQARAVALHHMDCPWRPADISQREGRIMRQGNQNSEVDIIRYVTERSFDAYMWQAVERKARFITQVMRGRLDVREVEEIDPSALSAAEAKAIASGNPLVLEHSTAQSEVARLQRLERAFHRNQRMLVSTRDRTLREAEQWRGEIDQLTALLPRVTDTSGENFRVRLADRDFTSRVDAAEAIALWARSRSIQFAPKLGHREYGQLGEISGFAIKVETVGAIGEVSVRLSLDGVPRGAFNVTLGEFLSPGLGLIQRIENRVVAVRSNIDVLRDEVREAEETVADLGPRIDAPFKHGEALREASLRLEQVTRQMAELVPGDSMSASADPPEQDRRTPPPFTPSGARRATPTSQAPGL
jgi:N12 class adenine-specific DNA methylase